MIGKANRQTTTVDQAPREEAAHDEAVREEAVREDAAREHVTHDRVGDEHNRWAHDSTTTVEPAVEPVRPERQVRRRRGSVLAMRRSRGAVSGVWLVLLGIWGGLIPFVGPYFSYAFGNNDVWYFTQDRMWLNVLPGAAVLLGGLILGPTGNRLSGAFGAWLALLGGMWFLVGPTVSQLWGTDGVAAPIGQPLGSARLVVLEQLGYFYGLGALIVMLAAGALGRISVRSHVVEPEPIVESDVERV